MSQSKYSDVCGNRIAPSAHTCGQMSRRMCESCVLDHERRFTKFKMNHERFRIESFKHWPILWIDIFELAKSGFHYSGDGDRVICNFCSVELFKWEATDKVEAEHRRQSPLCLRAGHPSNIRLRYRFS